MLEVLLLSVRKCPLIVLLNVIFYEVLGRAKMSCRKSFFSSFQVYVVAEHVTSSTKVVCGRDHPCFGRLQILAALPTVEK